MPVATDIIHRCDYVTAASKAVSMDQGELIHVDDTLWVLTAPTGLSVYDFDFGLFFTCRHPWRRPERIETVARVGVYEDYDRRYKELADDGIILIHSPDDHRRASELPDWYPLITDLTPKSIWFDRAPEAAEVAAVLRWPVFVKGQRQTSQHKRSLSIIDGPHSFNRAMAMIKEDPILQWQGIVCREYIPLRPVEDPLPDRIPSSFEFRTFWWRGQLWVVAGTGGKASRTISMRKNDAPHWKWRMRPPSGSVFHS